MEDTAVNPAGEATPEVEAETTPEVAADAAPSDAQSIADSVDPVKKADAEKPEPVDEDPEIELDEGVKLRKSELAKAIKRRKELDRAAFDKFQQASEIRKRLDSLRESDPEEYFRFRGVDPVQFAVERLQREIAMREATPEQRRSMQLEHQLNEERAQREQFQAQIDEERNTTQRNGYIQKLNKELPVAMQKHGLQADPLTYSLVAQQVRHQVVNDLPEDFEGAAEVVADTYRDSFKKHAATLKYEDVAKHYPEIVKVIREGDLARAKSTLPLRNDGSKQTAPRKPATPERTGAEKFNQYFDDWAGLGIRRPS